MENLMGREQALRKLFATEYSVWKWMKIVHFLGILPDKKLAKKINVSQSRISQVRSALGIGPVRFPILAEKYGYVSIESFVIAENEQN